MEFSDTDGPFAKTYHGLTIVNDSQNIVGRITSWNPTAYTRDVIGQYELSYKTFGRPVDNIPGRSTGYTVTGTSAEMWDNEFEIRTMANGGDKRVFNDLADQIRPFAVFEHWFKGQNLYRQWAYKGCWLTERNEDAYSSDGDARVLANFTFSYVSRVMIG